MLGTILTIVFGIVSVASLAEAIRARRYPCKLDFYVHDFGRIISPKAKKYDTIKLMHNDEEIKNAFYLKCFFVCTGDDIVLPEDSKSGMQIVLPAGYKWLEVHSQESTTGLNVSLHIDADAPNRLCICSTLIKRDEIYSFEAYIGGEEETRILPEEILIQHRIKGLGKLRIQETDLRNILETKQKLKFKGFAYAFIIIFFGLLLVNTMFCRSVRFVEKDNPEKIHTAMLVKNDTIAVSVHHSALFPWDRQEYAISSFNEKFELESTLPKYTQEGDRTIVVLYIIVAISYIARWGMYAAEYFRRKRLREAIENAGKDRRGKNVGA